MSRFYKRQNDNFEKIPCIHQMSFTRTFDVHENSKIHFLMCKETMNFPPE